MEAPGRERPLKELSELQLPPNHVPPSPQGAYPPQKVRHLSTGVNLPPDGPRRNTKNQTLHSTQCLPNNLQISCKLLNIRDALRLPSRGLSGWGQSLCLRLFWSCRREGVTDFARGGPAARSSPTTSLLPRYEAAIRGVSPQSSQLSPPHGPTAACERAWDLQYPFPPFPGRSNSQPLCWVPHSFHWGQPHLEQRKPWKQSTQTQSCGGGVVGHTRSPLSPSSTATCPEVSQGGQLRRWPLAVA